MRKLLGRKLWKPVFRVAAAWGKGYCVVSIKNWFGESFKILFISWNGYHLPITKESTTVLVTTMG